MNSEKDAYLIPQLKKFRSYLNTTWKGEFVGTEKPTYDIQNWERILNGTHIRIMHSLNDGEYGGETKRYYNKTAEIILK